MPFINGFHFIRGSIAEVDLYAKYENIFPKQTCIIMARQQPRDRGARRKHCRSGAKKNPSGRVRRYERNPQHPGSQSFRSRMSLA